MPDNSHSQRERFVVERNGEGVTLTMGRARLDLTRDEAYWLLVGALPSMLTDPDRLAEPNGRVLTRA